MLFVALYTLAANLHPSAFRSTKSISTDGGRSRANQPKPIIDCA